ncbi:MAG: hypothetical protein ACLUUJ_04280 [Acutalibacteraceae bacterium]
MPTGKIVGFALIGLFGLSLLIYPKWLWKCSPARKLDGPVPLWWKISTRIMGGLFILAVALVFAYKL